MHLSLTASPGQFLHAQPQRPPLAGRIARRIARPRGKPGNQSRCGMPPCKLGNARSGDARTRNRQSLLRRQQGSARECLRRCCAVLARSLFRATTVTARHTKFAFDECAHSRVHGWKVRRTKGFQQHCAVTLQTQWKGERRIAPQPTGNRRKKTWRTQITAGRRRSHAEAQSVEPTVLVTCEIWKPTETERLGHESQILQHQPLLRGH